MKKLSEDELIRLLKDDDEEAFTEVVDSYKHKVVGLCCSYTNNYQEAEDLSQEVFISLYKSIKSFRGDCSISTYIYKITLSRCMDFKRKKGIKNLLSGLITFSKPEENNDDKNFIRDCIKDLPENLKQVIILYYYTGLTQKKIGEILDIPAKTVEGRIYRAKQKLKEQFEKEGFLVCSKSGII